MKTHQITGIGPQAADGSVQLFTTQPHPFTVTKEWLDAQPAYPAVGNELVVEGDGTLVLAVDTSVVESAEAQKKTDTSGNSGDGSAASQLLAYTVKPFDVTAGKVAEIGDIQEGKTTILLEDGTPRFCNSSVIPSVGNYWVTDGAFEWFMPAAMFENKFTVKA